MVLQTENFVARSGASENRIGWLMWFKIGDENLDQTILESAFIDSELPSKYKMPDIRPADAFRRASKAVEGVIKTDSDTNETLSLLCRDVASTKDEVIRHLVVERRNPKTRNLKYDECAAVLTFYHDSRTIQSSQMLFEDYVSDAVNRFEETYQYYLRSFDGQAKRRMVRSVLDDLAAASLKESGGVYLVPKQNETLLFQLLTFINDLPSCVAYKMPVEDTSEARDMVRDVVTNKVQGLIAGLRNTLMDKDTKLTDKQFQSLLSQAQKVRGEVELYQNVLKETIGTLETDVELLQAQMMALVEEL